MLGGSPPALRRLAPVTLDAALTASLAAAPAAQAAPLPTTYTLPGEGVFPEGVAVDKYDGEYFAGSTSTGTIYRGTLDQPRAQVFLPGGGNSRTAATGLRHERGRLYVSGAATGRFFVYDGESGRLIRSFTTGSTEGFVNDVAVTRNGDAYVTDSFRPVLYRMAAARFGDATSRPARALPWLDLTTTPIAYGEGFNLNGIVETDDERYLIAVQSNTGQLWRIDLRTKAVRQIRVRGGALTAGDGLVLRGNTLYVVRNAFNQIAVLRLSYDLTRASVMRTITSPRFQTPTTAALDGTGRLLVVNSQFAGPGTPPFTLSAVPVSGDTPAS